MKDKPAFQTVFMQALLAVLCFTASVPLHGQERFPQPEFTSDYTIPTPLQPHPRQTVFDYIDTAILIAALASASLFALKFRRRTGLIVIAVFSVFYFGFFWRGCVCPIGAIQNMAMALFNPHFAVPITVILFFTVPLIFALFTGRTFCSGVCPFGALQELVIVKPLRLPQWVSSVLGIIPPAYLCLSVLLAATGSGFIICRFDPFIGFFRFGATFEMFVAGLLFLLAGTVVARPYCRFVCPYGVILGWLSRLSYRHVKIAPEECIRCRLCEDVCPVDAIRPPVPETMIEERKTGIRRLGFAILFLPLIAFGTGFALSLLSPYLALLHPDVRLARQIRLENAGEAEGTTLESDAFRMRDVPFDALFEREKTVRGRMTKGAWIAGSVIGFLAGLTLIASSRWKKRSVFEIDRRACVSCGRCFEVCSKEQEERRKTTLKKKEKTNERD